tara:strand:- start:56 stop:310 length:255 start_codon:yes stop_codon:yes gene_type:complete
MATSTVAGSHLVRLLVARTETAKKGVLRTAVIAIGRVAVVGVIISAAAVVAAVATGAMLMSGRTKLSSVENRKVELIMHRMEEF